MAVAGAGYKVTRLRQGPILHCSVFRQVSRRRQTPRLCLHLVDGCVEGRRVCLLPSFLTRGQREMERKRAGLVKRSGWVEYKTSP